MSESIIEQPNDKDFWVKQLAVEMEKLRANLDLVTSLKVTALMLVSLLVTLVIYHGVRSRIRFPMTLYHIYYHGLNQDDRELVRRDSRWRDDLNDKCRKLEDKIAKLEASFQPLSERLHFIIHRMEARERKLCSIGGQMESTRMK